MSLLVPIAVAESLETQRLLLRPFNIDDWPAMHRYYADPECARYTTGRVLTEGESWRTMAAMMGHWQIHGYGPYAITQKTNGELLGVTGFWYPGDWPEPEIKWGLLPGNWGKGFAQEAAEAVLQEAWRSLPKLRLISLIRCDNYNSAKLARAMGASLEKTIDFRQQRFDVFRHRSAQGLD